MNNRTTFMGTLHTDIPTENLISLDGQPQDVHEIYQYMQFLQSEDKDIYRNPAIENRTNFSAAAITLLKNHPMTSEFIVTYEAEEERLSALQDTLPDVFFNYLHQYLFELYDIGNNGASEWCFPDDTIDACQMAKIKFHEEIIPKLTPEQQKILLRAKINFSMRGGAPPQESYRRVVEGEGEFFCVISQQIYLWSMLRHKKPSLVAPYQLVIHWQARDYNLGEELPAGTYSGGVVDAHFRDNIFRVVERQRARLLLVMGEAVRPRAPTAAQINNARQALVAQRNPHRSGVMPDELNQRVSSAGYQNRFPDSLHNALIEALAQRRALISPDEEIVSQQWQGDEQIDVEFWAEQGIAEVGSVARSSSPETLAEVVRQARSATLNEIVDQQLTEHAAVQRSAAAERVVQRVSPESARPHFFFSQAMLQQHRGSLRPVQELPALPASENQNGHRFFNVDILNQMFQQTRYAFYHDSDDTQSENSQWDDDYDFRINF